MLVLLIIVSGIVTGQLGTSVTGQGCGSPEAPDNGQVWPICNDWYSLCGIKWCPDGQWKGLVKCILEDCPQLSENDNIKLALQSCNGGYSMSCDADGLQSIGGEKELCHLQSDNTSGSTGSSVGTGTNNSLTLPSVTSVMANDDRGGNDENGNIRTKREVQTGCNGVIWCQGDGNWGTPVRCLPISSTAPNYVPTSTSSTASALTTFPVGPSNSMVYTGAGNYTSPPRHKTETITRTPLASQPTPEVTKTDLTSGTTVVSILTTIKKITTKTCIPFTKTSKGASSIQMTPTTKGAAFTTDSSYTKTKLTMSAFTGSVSPTNQPNAGTYPTTSRQQFSQATSNSGGIFDTNKVHRSSTEDWKYYTTTGKPSSVRLSSETATPKILTTTEPTVEAKEDIQTSMQPSVKRTFYNTSVAKTTLPADQMRTPTEHVITSPQTEQSYQDNASSSVEITTNLQNSQGHNDQLGAPGNNDGTSDGVVDNTAMVAGISSAAGISVLVPLLVFVLKRLYRAAKVSPKPDGLFGNSEKDGAIKENKRSTQMTSHV